jgi:DNA-binding XRE family transcriptional regulator
MLVARDLEAPEMPTPSLQEIAQEQPTEFLHQRLRNERLRVGLSQRELAALGEVSRPSQVGYECGKTYPTISYLRKIQDIIDVRRVLFDDAGRII